MQNDQITPQNDQTSARSEVPANKIKPNRDNQTFPMFEKVTLKYEAKPIQPNGTSMPTSSDNSRKPLPEIELFLHHNFNMLRAVPQANDGVYGGESMISYRTTFDVDLEGHPLYKMVSSIIVYSGVWKIYAGDALVATLGPGQYKEVSDIGIINDSITRIESEI